MSIKINNEVVEMMLYFWQSASEGQRLQNLLSLMWLIETK